jgi:hypothetical protein
VLYGVVAGGFHMIWCGEWCGWVCSQSLRRVEFDIVMSGFGKLINPPAQT